MKQVVLRKEPIDSIDLFQKVLSNSPREPLSVDAIRKRCRVLDKLDMVNGSECLELEDQDHATLSQALDSTPWTIASRDILQVIDDVKNAKEPT